MADWSNASAPWNHFGAPAHASVSRGSSWTYHLAHLNAKYGIAPLLVVCQDESTAWWASRAIRIGPPPWPSLTVRPPSTLSFFRSETSQRLRAEVRTEGLSDAVVRILERRGVPLSQDARDRIHGCTCTGVPDEWLARALSATKAEDLFTHA